jgi:hypothetical protein
MIRPNESRNGNAIFKTAAGLLLLGKMQSGRDYGGGAQPCIKAGDIRQRDVFVHQSRGPQQQILFNNLSTPFS